MRILVLFLVVQLMGCSNHVVENKPTKVDSLIALKIAELSDYAREHSAYKTEFGGNKNYNYIIDYESLPKSLIESYEVKYAGNVEILLQSLSKSCGFNLNIIGIKPAKPITVLINDKDKKLIDILYHIGSQLSDDITLATNVDVTTDSFNVALDFGK